MSFSPAVRGLEQGRYPRANNTVVGMGGLALDGPTHPCTDWFGFPVACPSCGDSTTPFAVALGSIAFDTSGDYFAVSVLIHGPFVTTPGTCHDPASPTDNPCGGPGDPAIYDATLTGSYLRATSNFGDEANVYEESIPSSFAFNSDTTPSGVAWPRDVPHPGRNVGADAWLINPAATWPTPDAFGNVFGQCLFTLAQLPSAIGMTIVHHNREQASEGDWRVGVRPYYLIEGDEPDAGEFRQYIVGAA